MASVETYSIVADTLNGLVGSDRLIDEIEADAGITTALDPRRVETAADVLDVVFVSAIDGDEKTALDAVVAAHDGTPADVVGNYDEMGLKTATFGIAPIQNSAPGATPEIDWRLGQKCEMTLDATVTAITFVVPPGIGHFTLVVKQPAGANHPINAGAWPEAAKWPGDTAPVITAANGAVDKLEFYYDGTDYIGSFTQDHK